ncbi:hypothetical protein P153DRAFT_295027 [Dothidotthia symphoricarpi CBS 119687]|uniref:Uncharacterized protein n=1 Tax=Dothidotthia symphoricarpi CBS 119687 TaxID=1392245 RepID=A0A6A6AA02_9PLEO|nr:uncharacterized protein P153DRAFT_295027 [Dothidotthia symphoricarpi CBS 119687]KAF2127677.1 hypothetical protein P153DRAFT_295027 [Dothidotthia symphoricarpi CBS 119687]
MSSADIEKRSASTSTGDSSDATTTFVGNGRTSSGNVIIYKEHHEASTIELFYDLFFVANLALINYLKLFTLLWFTWLSTTLFDVRFNIDCVWNRLHKAIQFGVFAGFVFAGPVYDKYSKSGVSKSYKDFAIVLIVSRVAISVQYAVVMWQGRLFKSTLLPLGLSTLVHISAAVGYMVTLLVFPVGPVGLPEQVTWFIISIVEGLLIFLIAMTWRIVSFKYTHLVERLQLLTLIIIGEGIIGVVKSIACITKGQTSNNLREFGTVGAAVLLLYILWMLYFDQLSSDRFGTVRQQIWSLLHYPLHMAILICVEGNTSLIVWNSAVQALKWIWSMEPSDYSDPAAGFEDTAAFLSHLNKSMYSINAQFTSKYWNDTYKWESNFTAIENYTASYGFGSDEWNNKTGSLVNYIFTNAQIFVFEAHADTLAKLNAVTAPSTSRYKTLEAVYGVFNVTVTQFYAGAGAMLIVLAVMYWFNKLHKTKVEFGEMINRVVVGFTLLIVGVVAVLGNQSTSGFKFVASHWAIPIVVMLFVGGKTLRS